MLALKDLHLLKLVERGDYVISLRSFQGGVEFAHHRGIISPAYTVLTPRLRARREFFEFFFKSPQFVSSLLLFVTGIRQGQNIDYGRLSRMLLPTPPIKEQVAIGGFLRSASAQIARFIRAKRRLIELLNEQKQAIIHQAVTRGLDPNVRLKPSGIDWLGEVPDHWMVIPLKHAFQLVDYGISDSTTDSGKIRVLTMGSIQNGQVRIPDAGGVDTVDIRLLLRKGDLLFNRTNSAELVGKVGLFRSAPCEVTFASYLVRLRARDAMDPDFLNHLLNSAAVLRIARQVAVPSLHQSNLNPTRYGRIQVRAAPRGTESDFGIP